MDSHSSPYRSFLLRVWREGASSHTPCRALLEEVGSQQRIGFPDLEALLTFLLALTTLPEEEARTSDPTS